MKKLCSSLLTLFILPFFLFSQAYAAEYIDSFFSSVTINKEGTAIVQETISYYFPESRHGIFRKIKKTLTNEDGKEYELGISVKSVLDDKGRSYEYSQSQSGDYLTIKIGDPDKYVSGLKVYIINYEVRGALESFSDHDELYWNATGNEWEVAMNNVLAKVELPSKNSQNINAACYTGSSRSKEKACTITNTQNTASYTVTRKLSPGEGLTIVAGFDKGIVPIIPKEEVQDFSFIFFILGVIWYVFIPGSIILFYLFLGRDPKINTAIPALFEDPKDENLRVYPAMAGTVIDESADNEDISATIVDLAIRGYLKITETKKKGLLSDAEFLFTKTEDYKVKDKVGNLNFFEEKLIQDMFGSKNDVTTAELKKSFATDAVNLKNSLYKDSVQSGYFPNNPNTIRTFWFIVGFIALVTINIPFGIMCILFAKAMPRKTVKGIKVQVQILGLKKFLTTQERQLEFQEQNWFLFEKFLPYAIAFRVTETWAKRFENLQAVPETSWYSGTSALNMHAFASSMNVLSSNVASAATPTRSSGGFSSGFSGGGFSGGGGGGGGGGSW